MRLSQQQFWHDIEIDLLNTFKRPVNLIQSWEVSQGIIIKFCVFCIQHFMLLILLYKNTNIFSAQLRYYGALGTYLFSRPLPPLLSPTATINKLKIHHLLAPLPFFWLLNFAQRPAELKLKVLCVFVCSKSKF